MKKPTLLLAILFFVEISWAQDCNCDHTITPDDRDILAENGYKGNPVLPGDTICFEAGVHEGYKFFKGLKGTKENPIVMINCGGQVTVKGTFPSHNGIATHESENFVITGTGDPDHFYGFVMEDQFHGIVLGNLSKNFEIDHVEIINAGSHGLDLKTNPSCDPMTWRENGFVNEYVIVHDVKVNTTVDEGFYIGDSHYHTTVNVCGGMTVEETPILKVEVYDNIVENTGADGIQVGSAIEYAKIHHNIVRNYAVNQANGNTGHASGVQVNPGSKAHVHNNLVLDGKGPAYFLSADGATLYNNISNNTGGGVTIIERTISSNVSFKIFNNTFLNVTGWNVYMLSDKSVDNLLYNNIIHSDPTSEDARYVVVQNNALIAQENNLLTNDIDELGLKSIENEDYHLTELSESVIDKGNCSDLTQANVDFYEENRVIGPNCDIGASEYKPAVVLNSKDLTKRNLTVYPNPVTAGECLKVELTNMVGASDPMIVGIYNVAGQKIDERKVVGFDLELQTDSWTKGTYIVKVKTENSIQTQKILIK